jgi:glutathione S-transferase
MAEFTLVIGNKNYSSWSLRPWIYMKHLGIAFDEVHVSLYSDSMIEQTSPYFSNDKVPVLKHNELEVWDSLAIIEYVSAYCRHEMNDDNAKRQAVIRSLCAEMHSSFFAIRNELPMNCRRKPAELVISKDCLNDVVRVQALWQYASQYSDGKGDWLFGSFSMADAMFAPVVLRFSRYKVTLRSMAAEYVDHVLNDPLMMEWIEAGCAEPMVIDVEER